MNETTVRDIANILEFLGEENEEKIKTALTNAIIENLEESLNERWFLCPDTISDQLTECYDKIYKKHKKEITSAIEQKVLNMIEKIAIDESKGV
jgi:hypoxanthine phosphoribosyltransferase